jgi:hypothetical protein
MKQWTNHTPRITTHTLISPIVLQSMMLSIAWSLFTYHISMQLEEANLKSTQLWKHSKHSESRCTGAPYLLCIYVYVRLSEWQEEPKSIILIPLRRGCLSSTFSGFRSQWIMSTSGRAKNAKLCKSCLANFLVRFKEIPLNFVFRNKSYRLYDNISKTMHWWFRNIKVLIIWTTLGSLSAPPSLSRVSWSNSISDWACNVKGLRDFMILMATSFPATVSKAQTTWPNDPYEHDQYIVI